MNSCQDDTVEFLREREINIEKIETDSDVKSLTKQWFKKATDLKYSYNFDWLGLPIIQFPQDIVALQEVIWKTKPTLIIETGIARGGSLIFSASILHLLNQNGKVIGVDIDIREHNRRAIESHPLASRIELLEGSSIDNLVIEKISSSFRSDERIMVILDSNHTHEHVLNELNLYSKFVSKGCYIVVMDTCIQDMPDGYYKNRPWNLNDNPKTAVKAFLNQNNHFKIDKSIQNKLLITSASDGFLLRTEDEFRP